MSGEAQGVVRLDGAEVIAGGAVVGDGVGESALVGGDPDGNE